MKIAKFALRLRRPIGSTTVAMNSMEVVRIPVASPTNLCVIPCSAHAQRRYRIGHCRFAREKQYEFVH
jgi:hypothetical protein